MRLLTLALLAVASFILSSCGDTSPSEPDNIGAWVFMKMEVQERLKSPSTADFPFGGHQDVVDIGNGRFKVSSYVDSQNSFGATVRTRFKCTVKYKGSGSGYDSWILESITMN